MSATDLTGKVAIVTGSGRGLGRAYALALAAANAAVVVNDVDSDAADEVVRRIIATGGRSIAVVAPVGSTESAEALIRAAQEAFGRVDIMVANAGVLRDKVLWKMSDADFDAVINTHLRGAFTCGRAAASAMREQGEGGRIILIGSPAGQFGSFGQTNYAAAKAGIVAMARTWSLELARANITANVVIPTAMTAMTATIPAYAELYKSFEAGEPLPRDIRRDHALGGPEDVAPLVVWLASDDAANVTGQAIGIGGDKITLYSHPAERAAQYRDGGWTPSSISAAWAEQFQPLEQPSGATIQPISK
ncbi:SDR family NAD(P)-dependent oxidoreductase [Pseudarthrobacter sp. NPDC058329]|uniref:SDR family NAD(P)-dependent oxidoreductase n=1 Tax=Pseudarthrobacter sp. NPDC058329 TaxID=3346448 RepID=UPI0036DB1288